jgi:hypothetical protein
VGPYDRYAIRWGYAPVDGARTPDDERPTLDGWARLQDSVPWYRYGGDEGIAGPDPGEATEAVGDADAVRATALGPAQPAPRGAAARAGDDGGARRDVRRPRRDVRPPRRAVGHGARPRGAHPGRRVAAGQGGRAAGAVYVPVGARRQREAVAFLNAHAFATPAFLLDPEVLSRIEAQGAWTAWGARSAACSPCCSTTPACSA